VGSRVKDLAIRTRVSCTLMSTPVATVAVGIVTGGVNPLGFSLGSKWVRVWVEIFYPDQNPYPV